MMHKVKDVVSKLFHPSFLFTPDSDTDRSKRKRPDTVEENDDQVSALPTTTTERNGRTTTSTSRYQRSTAETDRAELSDDDDETTNQSSSGRNGVGEERQNKRLRTGNYSHLLSTRTHAVDQQDTRRFSPSTSTPTRGATSTSTEPKRYPPSAATALTTINEIRFASPDREFYSPSTDRRPKPSYDPSQSPLFSTRSQKTPNTTSNVESNEHSTNYLLASSLTSRPHSSGPRDQPSSGTFSNPTNDQWNRSLSIDRHVYGSPYSSPYTRRLPYIERLRQRTLQDGLRLNRTVDNEVIAKTPVEQPKTAVTAVPSKQVKASEKECGVQCDIEILEHRSKPNEKQQLPSASANVSKETPSVPTSEKETSSSIQTNSSITIERAQPSLEITKPKVLGNITPFSWPKFARAQDAFAKNHPDKCSSEKTSAPSIPEKLAVSTAPPFSSSSGSVATTTSKLPTLPTSVPSPAQQSNESIWKCSACTKENPIQAASCSLCHGANPNLKRSTPSGPAAAKQADPVTPFIRANPTPTTTKESSSPAPFGTGSAMFTVKSTPPMFGTLAAINTAEKTNLSVTNIPPSMSHTALPAFGTASTIPFPITTKESTSTAALLSFEKLPAFPTSGINPPFSFGLPTTTASFGSTISKESSTTTSAPSLFNVQPTVTSSNRTFQTSSQFQGFGSLTSTPLLSSTIGSTGSAMPLTSFKLSGTAIPPVTPADSSLLPSIASGGLFGSSTSTTTAPSFTFGTISSPSTSDSTSSTARPSSSVPSFNFGGSPALFASPQSSVAVSTSTAGSQPLPFGSPNAPPLFTFGPSSNSNPSGMLTSGFPIQQAPITSTSFFNTAAIGSSVAPFQFAGPTFGINQTESILQPPDAVAPMIEESPRVIRKAKRHLT